MKKITIKEIKAHSLNQRKIANQIIKDSNLIHTLNKIGKVHFVGSYSYNLMIENDIDIYVVNKKININSAVSTLNEIFLNKYFYYTSLINHNKFPQKGFPKGYYLGLKHIQNNKKWKIDIWLLKSTNSKDFIKKAWFDQKLKHITQRQKQQILKLKYISYINEIRAKHSIRSTDIYEAVLNNKVNKIEKYFLDYYPQIKK